jgi:hypothetical protein
LRVEALTNSPFLQTQPFFCSRMDGGLHHTFEPGHFSSKKSAAYFFPSDYRPLLCLAPVGRSLFPS